MFPSLASAATPAGATRRSFTLTVNFANAGTFAYICDVPAHDGLDMIGNLTVTQ